MGMILKYGTFTFPSETTLVQISKVNIFDGRNIRSKQRQIWKIRTILQAIGQTAITAAVDALEAELTDGKTLELFESNGITTTGQGIALCRVRNVNFPDTTGPEYANRRVVTIDFESTADVENGEDTITFQESLSFSGGGSISVMQETIEGKPRKFQTAEFSIFRAIQSGSSTGRNAFIDPPGPAFPGQGDPNDRPVIERSVIQDPDGEDRFGLRWTYRFHSDEEMTAIPNTWL